MSDYTRWRERFAAALDPRLYTIEHLDSLVLSMRAQCWFGEDAAIVTELREYPTRARAIHGLVAAGDFEEIAGTLIPRAEQWARSIGCDLALVESRPGWARVLRSSDYEIHQIMLRKELR